MPDPANTGEVHPIVVIAEPDETPDLRLPWFACLLGIGVGGRYMTSCSCSLAAHVVAAVSATLMFNIFAIQLSPPPSGLNSIQLVASVASPEAPQTQMFRAESTPPARDSNVVKLGGAQVVQARIIPMSPIGEVVKSINEKKVDQSVAIADNVSKLRLTERAQSPRHDSPRLTVAEASSRSIPRTASVSAVASRKNVGVQTDTLPEKIVSHSPAPVYPPDAIAKRISGKVDLRVRVGSNGRVQTATVFQTSGLQSMDEAALVAVRSWRFQPARLFGHAVAKEVLVGVRFAIAD